MTQRPAGYQGLVTTQTFDLLEGLAALAEQRGTSMAGLALAWLLADERVSQVVVGPGNPAQLAPLTEAQAHPLADDERREIDRLLAH